MNLAENADSADSDAPDREGAAQRQAMHRAPDMATSAVLGNSQRQGLTELPRWFRSSD
jgi:hypothetical protein